MIVICLFFSLCHFSSFFLFSLQSFHDLLSLLVFIDHNITNTEISHHDGCQTEHVISILIHNRLVVANSLIVPLENEENMSNVKFPGLMISTELCTLSKKLLNNWIIFFIPIYFSLRHKDGNIFLKALVKFFQRFFYSFIILCKSGILNTLCELP